MRTERVMITYRMTFESAFHFGTGLRGGLINRLVARDHEGFLYVPGSTLKGVLRERCEHIADLFNLPTTSPHVEVWREANRLDPDIVARIFGTRFLPSRLFFDDAQMTKEDRALFESEEKDREAEFKAWQVERRTQVSLSRRTRTAQQGMLFTSEYGIRDLHFESTIVGALEGVPLQNFYTTALDVGTFPLLLLITGLLSVDRLGGSKSTGAGNLVLQIEQIRIEEQEISPKDLLQELPTLEAEIYEMCKESVL